MENWNGRQNSQKIIIGKPVGNPWTRWCHLAVVEKPFNFWNIKSEKNHFDLIRTVLSRPKRTIQILENVEYFRNVLLPRCDETPPHRCTCTSQLCSSCIAMAISSEPPHWSGTKRIPVVKQVDISGRTYRLMYICITKSRRENSKTP